MDGKFSQKNELINIRRGKIFAQSHKFIMHLFLTLFTCEFMCEIHSMCEIAASLFQRSDSGERCEVKRGAKK